MQLDKGPLLRAALTAASCSLLGITPPASADPSSAESALLYYSEKDRVNVAEAAAILTLPMSDEMVATVTPMVDAISGASPNGASPTNQPQTVGGTTTAAGDLPLSSFKDQRLALALQWAYPNDRMNREIVGFNVSSENDYLSLGGSYEHMTDFNHKLSTLAMGISDSLDSVEPTGGVIPTGLSATAVSQALVTGVQTTNTALGIDAITGASGVTLTTTGEDTAPKAIRGKQLFDALVGVTQVINRRLLMQFNYSLGTSNGYLTDPYKLLSQVDATSGQTTGYLTERRPDFRLRQNIYWKAVLHLPEDVIHFSYRHYWDDWGIQSDMAKLAYHFKLPGGAYIEPQARYYSQSAADFYHHSLVAGSALPRYASADYRLARMDSVTYSLKLSLPLGKDNEVNAKFSTMRQRGDSHPADAVGIQRNLDLYPGLDAAAIQVNWNFRF